MVLLFLAGTTVSAAQGDAPEKKAESAVAAKIGDKVITEGEIEARIRELHPEIQKMLADPATRRSFVERQVQILVCAMAAKDENLDKENAVKAKIEDGVNGILSQEYMTRRCPGTGEPTKEEMASYYKEHPEQFTKPMSVRARHILIALTPEAGDAEVKKALEKAESVQKRLGEGESFWKLAKEYSDDPRTKFKGGDLGYFTRERMVKPFADAAFSLKKGETSGPVRSPFGFHIIQLDDRKEGETEDFSAAAEKVRVMTAQWNQKKCMDEIFERLKKKYGVEIMP
jgi:peptidyl-prolyl cis-trans isomerase C